MATVTNLNLCDFLEKFVKFEQYKIDACQYIFETGEDAAEFEKACFMLDVNPIDHLSLNKAMRLNAIPNLDDTMELKKFWDGKSQEEINHICKMVFLLPFYRIRQECFGDK
jgi:hypothetical protein